MASQSRLRLLIFDADGTLSDSLGTSYEGTAHVFRQCGLEPPAFDEYCEYFQPPFMEFYRKRGVTATDNQINEWYRMKANHANAPLYHDVSNALQRWSARIRLAVVSAQAEKTLAIQLRLVAHHFDPMVGGKHDKTAEIRRIRDLCGLTEDEAGYVGDFGTDMRNARSAGVKAIGITRGRKTRQMLFSAGAHHVVDHLDELEHMIT